MSRKPLIFSLFCTLGLTIFSLITWLNLPQLEQYPIHWDWEGKADGFASRNAVLGDVMIIPITQVFTASLLYVIPKIEPLRENFEQSRPAYNLVWIAVMTFLTGVGITIVLAYKPSENIAINTPLPWMAAGLSLLYMVIGNVFGKVRQNFMFGIRTPWTLSSHLSWEKTHRIGGRLLVANGVICLVLVILMPNIAFPAVIISLLAAVIFSLIYSYIIWKNDPNKRS